MVQSERPRHNMVGEDGISSNAGSKNMDRLKRFGPSGVLGLLLLAFVLGNTDSTTVSFLFFSVDIPLIIVLVATAAVGSIMTLRVQRKSRKARRRDRSEAKGGRRR